MSDNLRDYYETVFEPGEHRVPFESLSDEEKEAVQNMLCSQHFYLFQLKKLVFVLLFLPVCLFAQMSGIPEQDSLLVKKDRVMILNLRSGGIFQLEYDWLDFQWRQWVGGKKQRLCMFSSGKEIYYSECVIDPGIDPNYLGDTLIHRPLPISFEKFMDYRLSKVR